MNDNLNRMRDYQTKGGSFRAVMIVGMVVLVVLCAIAIVVML